MTDDKVLLFKLHPCAQGLSNEEIEDVAGHAETLHYEPGDVVHRPDDVVQSVFLVIHGRLRLELHDAQDNVVLQRFQVAGGQFGGISAALGEPLPMSCVAEDPTVLLRIDYEKALELSRNYDAFRLNYVRVLSDAVKQSLFNDKTAVRSKLVVFFHGSAATRPLTRSLLTRLVQLGESIRVFSDQAVGIAGIDEVPVQSAGRTISPEEVSRLVADHLPKGRVVFDVDAAVDAQRATRGFEKSEQIFWFVTPECWQASLNQLKQILSRAPTWRDKLSIVWLLQPGQQPPAAEGLPKLANRDFKVTCTEAANDERMQSASGFERVLHLIRGVQVGVALGGGAARGMAHLGVLKALQESGITVDMIAGTSAGAMTGTLYASGLDPDYLAERFVVDLRPPRIFRFLPSGDQWYLFYKYRRGQFDPMLRKYLGDQRIEHLPIPMHAITVDLISAKAVVRESGDAVDAILESINLPVLSTPINRHGQALVDGGLINNVPANVLASKGCNFVIAVSVTAKMELEFAKNRPDTPSDQMRSASTLQTILRSYLVQSYSVNSLGVQPADFVIEPDVTQFELSEFSRANEMAAIGESATLDAIPKIKQLLNRLDGQLFPAAKE